MATSTTNLDLVKPDLDEDFNVQDFNGNMDILDRHFGAVESIADQVANKIDNPVNIPVGKFLQTDQNGLPYWDDPPSNMGLVVATTAETQAIIDGSSIQNNKIINLEDGKVLYDDLRERNDNANTYVTPEQFGAKGDNSTDDTLAIQAAITYAQNNRVGIRGYKSYKTTSTLVVNGSYLDLEIERINYSGNSAAVQVSGSYNNLRFAQLYCSNGRCIDMRRSSSGNSCAFNKISGMRFYAKSHTVNFIDDGQYIIYNTFDIRAAKSDNGDCYHGHTYVGENVFLHTSCDCQNGWAIYNCGGRFYNFTLEGSVLNGIYVANGVNYCSGFRIREMVDKMIRRINGTEPGARGGTLLKFTNNAGNFYFSTDDFIPYCAIDASEEPTLEDIITSGDEHIIDRICELAHYAIIDAPIRYGNWSTKNGFFNVGSKMIVVGGRKICIPAMESEYTVNVANFDMRDAQVDLNEAKPYPTKFIINANNCVIRLPASYCAYGYSEFIVDQSAHTCTIYDCNSNSTPIFNGAEMGAGVYRFKAYCNLQDNAVTRLRPNYLRAINDSVNFSWEIERIDEGYSSCGIANVADYGAVGDGVTDDSAAIQRAVNANYKVYFESDKTYYIGSAVVITHDTYLCGGKNTIIKTKTPQSGTINNGFYIRGSLKKTTSLTTDYTSDGLTDNSGNRFTLSSMSDVNIGDIMIITATDQHYSYNRPYYYLGGTLLISDKDDDYIYTSDALPWDIENTQNVTVKIYSAPTAIVENLHFQSDLNSSGTYTYLVSFYYCKNSIIRNCNITEMDNGFKAENCVNTLIENVTTSKTPDMGQYLHDHYGIAIYSCSNTTVRKVMAESGNACVDLSGTIPNINTWIKECSLFGSNRVNGFGMHENAYNTVLEDCVIGGAIGYGTMVINRCRFARANRVADSIIAITYRGGHIAKYSKLTMRDCVIEGSNLQISIARQVPSSPVQSYHSVIDEINIINCTGGALYYIPNTTETVLSYTINRLNLINWKNCTEIYHVAGSSIKHMRVENCEFVNLQWMNSHNNQFCFDGVGYLHLTSDYPTRNMMYAEFNKNGGKYMLPSGIPIPLTSSNNNAHFVVCGNNIASNNVSDWLAGSIGGQIGGALSRTINPSQISSLSVNSNGEIVCTNQGPSVISFFLNCMAYVDQDSMAMISVKLKNIGSTDGASFRPSIAVLDADTMNIQTIGQGNSVQATSLGATATYSRVARKNSYVQFYLYCNSPITNAQTVFVELNMTIVPTGMNEPPYQRYSGSSMDGDGTLLSVSGVNYIMCTEQNFSGVFSADYLPVSSSSSISALGVSF